MDQEKFKKINYELIETFLSAGKLCLDLRKEGLTEELKKDNISVEVVDLRTIFPLDEEIILKSIEKTSNLVILQEDVPFSSIASEVSSVVAEKGFWNLDNPIIKVTSPNTHIPFAPVLEDAFIPNSENLVKAIKELQ